MWYKTECFNTKSETYQEDEEEERNDAEDGEGGGDEAGGPLVRATENVLDLWTNLHKWKTRCSLIMPNRCNYNLVLQPTH